MLGGGVFTRDCYNGSTYLEVLKSLENKFNAVHIAVDVERTSKVVQLSFSG